MKKAKVIVPALALLALSASAAVTGSVAWFTTATTASVQFSQFSVKKIDGNLKTTTTALVGTRVSSGASENDAQIVSAAYTLDKDGNETETASKLTHASYDPTTNKIWTLGLGDDKVTKDDAAIDSSKSAYYTMSWQTVFEYDFGGATAAKPVNLYFDPASDVRAYNGNTDVTTTVNQSTSTKYAPKGFRAAMINIDTNDWVVWSPFQGERLDCNDSIMENEQSVKPKSRYVTSSTGTTDYDPTFNGNLIAKGQIENNKVERISESSGISARKDCVGQFTVPDDKGKQTITIKFVVWFEGEDANIVDNTEFYSVSGPFNFYIRENKATA